MDNATQSQTQRPIVANTNTPAPCGCGVKQMIAKVNLDTVRDITAIITFIIALYTLIQISKKIL
jgi:hypothetical protein